MDIEMKVQIPRACSSKKGNRCSSCPAFGHGGRNCIRNAMKDAATALSTLQAENEKLRYEVERQRRSADDRQHLYETAERAYMKVLAELEQARAEITRLKHYEDKCHDCPIVCAKTEIIKAHEELEAVQNERDMWKEGMEDCQQSILELETELEQVKRENLVLKEKINGMEKN